MTIEQLLASLPVSGLNERIEQACPNPLPDGRPLSEPEIRKLQAQGNSCADWKNIRALDGFNGDNISNNLFLGRCWIARSTGTALALPDGGKLPIGIHFSTIENTRIGNACAVHRCPFINNAVIANEVLLTNSTVSSSDTSMLRFGNGHWVDIGIETGGRTVPLFADLSLELAEFILANPGNPALQETCKHWITNWLQQIQRPYTVIAPGAVVSGCALIRDSYIGPGTVLINAGAIIDSTLDSRPEQAIHVTHGAIIEHSIIQEGVAIETQAIVRDSLMFEHSHASDHGAVVSSLVGPNSGVSKGEATASFLGPFIGFHHQSLLIASFWPGGRGNIGYGANVGSNHTTRLADQECWPGEGQFFGLNCCIKFPANFSAAPYSIVAAGVTTLPQRMSFPFSLITEREPGITGVPEGLNCLIPAWNLGENYFALKRNEEKFKSRNKATRNRFDLSLFRSDIMSLIEDALVRLDNVAVQKDYYLQEDIAGLGRNYLSERSRRKAIETYRFFLELVGLRAKHRERGPSLDSGDARRLMDMLPQLRDMTVRSRGRDFERGCAIIDDYHLTHDHPDRDPFLEKLRQEIDHETEELQECLKS